MLQKLIIAVFLYLGYPSIDKVPVKEKVIIVQAVVAYQKYETPHIPATLLTSLGYHETRYQPRLVSNKNARGLLQVVPKWVPHEYRKLNLFDIDNNVHVAVAELEHWYEVCNGNLTQVIGAWNTGKCRSTIWAKQVIRDYQIIDYLVKN